MDTPSIVPILQRIPIFHELNEQDHKDIIAHIVLNYYPAGHVFFKQGDDGDKGMLIIKHGMVKISRSNKDEGDKEVAVLSDNDFFGEMALVTSEARNATATAITDCEVFELSKDDFVKLMETNGNLAQKISTEFLNREKQNNLPNEKLI